MSFSIVTLSGIVVRCSFRLPLRFSSFHWYVSSLAEKMPKLRHVADKRTDLVS